MLLQNISVTPITIIFDIAIQNSSTERDLEAARDEILIKVQVKYLLHLQIQSTISSHCKNAP